MPNLSFPRFARATLVAVYLVILAGTVVRTTGSGMGCPDWPKCFGKWIPPTDESQLPGNYHEIYRHRGYADTRFNVYHTWTEYLNRLLGALLGILVVVLFILSLKFRKCHPIIPYLCGAEVLLTGFQGWLGAKVVSSNLAPLKVSMHMLVALMIVGVLVYVINLTTPDVSRPSPSAEGRTKQTKVKFILVICLLFTIIQILTGIKVRERIDTISFSMDYEYREKWVSLIGPGLDVHRIFAILVIALNVYLLRILSQNPSGGNEIKKYMKLTVLLFLIEFSFGFILTRFSFPAFAQPMHLLLASIIFGMQFYILIKTTKARTSI